MRLILLRLALLGILWSGVACQAAPPEEPTATPRPPATRIPSPTIPPTPTKPIPQKGGDLREIVSQDAINFHPYLTTDSTSRLFQERVYAGGLWLRDPKTLEPMPGLAEAWSIASDGKTYMFTLRKNLKWSDGAPLTANDFVWTFEQASKPENKYPYADSLDGIALYRAKDDYTLEVGLHEASCLGLTLADAITPLPKHIWSKLAWGDPAKNPEILQPTVVSGAYKLREWVRGNYAAFVRNDAYYRGTAYLDSITTRIVADPTIQFGLLKAGEVDVAPVSASDYAEASKVAVLKAYTWEPAAPEWDFIGLNLRRPFLKNALVRQALAYAIPRDQIADKAFAGLAKPLYSMFPTTASVFDPDAPRYAYNLATAKEMLQKAGYKFDANGKAVDKDNKPAPKLKILYNAGNRPREQIAKIAQEELRKLGLDSEATALDYAAYLAALRKEPFDFDLFILGWRAPLEPYLTYQLWSEANIPLLNPGAYVNPEVEKLYAQANRPPCDLASRKTVFGQIQKIVATDAPYIFLTARAGYAFVNKRVIPNEPTPLGIGYAPEQWFIVK